MAKWKDAEKAPMDGTIVLIDWGDDSDTALAYFGISHPNRQGKPCWRDSRSGHKLADPDRFVAVPSKSRKHWTAR